MVEPRRARGNRLVPQQSFVRNPMGFEPRQFTEKKKIPLDIFQGNLPQAPQTVSPASGGEGRYQAFLNPAPISVAALPQQFYQQASQTGMRGTIDQIDALTRQSQIDNPMVPGAPTFGVPNLQGMRRTADRNAQFMDAEPIAGSSVRAAGIAGRRPSDLINPVTSRAANAYNGLAASMNDPFRYNPMDPQMDARQRSNAAMVTAGRPMDRTRGDRFDGLAAYDASGGVPWYDRQDDGRSASPVQNMAPDAGAEQRALASPAGQRMLAQQRMANDPTQAEAFKAENLRRRALHNQAKADRENPNTVVGALREKRMAAAEARRQDLTNRTFRRNVARGMNPMSPQAQALFPNQVAAMRAENKPAVQNPMMEFAAGASNTPAGKLKAAENMNIQAATDPNLRALGIDPAAGLGGMHSSLAQQFEDDPNLAMDDSSLRSYQQFAQQTLTAAPDQADPANFTSLPGSVFVETEGAVISELWKELATLPDNAQARQKWLEKYKKRQQEIDKRQTDYYGAYGS